MDNIINNFEKSKGESEKSEKSPDYLNSQGKTVESPAPVPQPQSQIPQTKGESEQNAQVTEKNTQKDTFPAEEPPKKPLSEEKAIFAKSRQEDMFKPNLPLVDTPKKPPNENIREPNKRDQMEMFPEQPPQEPTQWFKDLEAMERGKSKARKLFGKLRAYAQDRFKNADILNRFLPNKDYNFYRDIEIMFGEMDGVVDKRLMPKMREAAEIIEGYGLKESDVHEYLYALHALDANRKSRAESNGKVTDASGMTDGEADAIIKKVKELPATKREGLEKIRDLNRSLNKWAYEYAVESGMKSREDTDGWLRDYPDYVPLRGLESAELEELLGFNEHNGTRKGIEPAAWANIARRERKTRAQDVFSQNFADKLALIVNAERNRAMQSMLKAAEANPDPFLWKIDPRETMTVDGEEVYDSHASREVNTVKVFVGGKEHVIKFYDTFGFGKQLADNIKGMTEEFRSPVYRGMAEANRIYKSMMTNYNPEFIPVNLIRDIPFTAFTTFSDYGLKTSAKTMAKIVPILLANLANSTGKIPKNKLGELREDFAANGGTTGYTRLYRNREMAKLFKGMIRTEGASLHNAAVTGRKVLRAIELINSSVEDACRMAIYDTLVKEGKTKAEAAHAAKNVSVNFNRRGSNKWLDQMFLFINPTIQGIHGVVSRLFSDDPAKRKRAWLFAGMAFSLGLAARIYNQSASDEADNGRLDIDNVPYYIKNGNLVICHGNGRATTIPLSYELRPFYAAGQMIAEGFFNEKFTAKDFAAGLANSIMDGYNPLGSDIDIENISGTITDLATPYFFKPIVDLAVNKDFTGKAIVPEPPSYLGYDVPQSHRYREGVNPYLRDLAIWLNDITGGSEFESGGWDKSPEAMEHLFNSYLVGLASITGRAIGMAKSISEGEEIQPRQVPIFRRFMHKASPSIDRGTSREAKKKTGAVAAKLGSYNSRFAAAKSEEETAEIGEESRKFLDDNYGYVLFDAYFKSLTAPESRVRKYEKSAGTKFKGKGAKAMFDELSSKITKAYDRIERLQAEYEKTDSPEKREKLRRAMEKAAQGMAEGYMESGAEQK